MLDPFFLKKNEALVDKRWREKNLLSSEILDQAPLRQMRPEAIGDRTRLDLMWNGEALGLRGPATQSGVYEFFELENPDTAHPQILEMMRQFREFKCPLKMAQIRFRVGADEKIRGLWIDTSNEEIKSLLDEKSFLARLLQQGWIIEMGQKHKAVDADGKLGAPRAEAWLASYTPDNESLLLRSYISLFSQPGPEVNRALIAAGLDLLDTARVPDKVSWCEWGAGYGNLSAAFAPRLGPTALSTEMDAAAAELLAANAREFFTHVEVSTRAADMSLGAHDLWILDPPRPGFGKLLGTLKDGSLRPRWILNYHCHNSGLLADNTLLKGADYRLLHWSSVDAFPATPHHEAVSLWENLR